MKKIGLKDNYKEILNEDLNDKLDVIMEYVKDIPDIKRRVTRLEEKFENVHVRTEVLEVAIASHSSQLQRLNKLLPA